MRGAIEDFRKALLDWFDQHRRDLPWRNGTSLYKTVVSEFMLQQTQVDTALPYFERWIRELPDFETLARAPESRVLKLWEGLGYYSRARNLHKLAKSVLAEGIPETPGQWRQRPGVGPYTAAAISSIAQSRPEPVIDGNVIRVLSRLVNDATPVRSSAQAQKRLGPLAATLIDPARPGDYNEALMELGATVCRKTRPACLLCPVNEHCEARAAGTEAELPVVVRKAATKRDVFRLWLRRNGCLLLHIHPDHATRLAGLAELPQLMERPPGDPVLSRSRGISSERIREHIFVLPDGHPLARNTASLPSMRWVPLSQIEAVSLSAPHKRWIGEIISLSNFSA